MKTKAPPGSRLSHMHSDLGVSVFNIAHRGARAFAPENTLPAFEKAQRMGCHMVELDVHLSADACLVVHHDDGLRRCTDVEKRYPKRTGQFISDFTLAEISALDAGAWFVHELALEAQQRQPFLSVLTSTERAACVSRSEEALYASGTVRVPTLEAVLELVEASRLLVNIEIKTLPRMYPAMAAKVLDCVERFGLSARVLISSFDHEQLAAVRARNADIATAVLTSDRLHNVARYLELLDADAFHPGCYGDYDSLGFGSVSRHLETRGIDDARAAGKHVNVWTCNDESQMRSLINAGVTGIVTDYPNRLSPVLASSPQKSPAA